MTLHDQFIRQIRDLFPNESSEMLEAIMTTDATVSIRTNAAKTDTSPEHAGRVPWCGTGFYLRGREAFTFDPAFHSGLYYVQDASSMIIDYVINKLIDAPVRYLDLCAAPGGKSTTAAGALPEGSLLVCNEIVPQRANILKENIIKWGYPDCVVTNDDSANIGRLTHFFDVIAADVPCSGEGMFRKDPEAVAQWTPSLVAQCADRQRDIIDNVWNALKPGGLFIYSTCTFNRDENEEMVRYIIDNYNAMPLNLDIPKEWNIHQGLGDLPECCRFLPHMTRGEGLFLCVLRKPDGESRALKAGKSKENRKKPTKNAVKIDDAVKSWLADDQYTFFQNEDSIFAIADHHCEAVAMLRANLRTIHAGIGIATIKGKDIVPAHSLAMSTMLNAGRFHTTEVDYHNAIACLRGESVSIDTPLGYTLLTHNGTPLCFAKQLGNRANNLYPKEWRIRSTHIPETEPEILQNK